MNSKQYKITLKQGDACKVKGLTVEQYHSVCKRFIESGAGGAFYSPNKNSIYLSYVEWYKPDLCHANYPEEDATIYTYEQIMEKDMNTFSKKDLKTGMILVQGNGQTGMVLLGTANGDIVSGSTWYPLTSIDEDLTKHYGREYDIVEVWQPRYNNDYLGHWAKPDLTHGCEKIWERKPELTPDQIKQQELQARYDAAKKELEELGKALGTVK